MQSVSSPDTYVPGVGCALARALHVGLESYGRLKGVGISKASQKTGSRSLVRRITVSVDAGKAPPMVSKWLR